MSSLPLRLAVFLLLLVAAQGLSAKDFDVTAFGAKGDGQSLDTAAINRAIAAANANGGGTVSFPAGNYLSYSIHLQSNVRLYLGMGATLIAAEPSEDGTVGYDPAEANPAEWYQDFGHAHWHNSLMWGENLENIAIEGPGTISGRGLSRDSGHARRDLLPEERTRGVKLPDAAFSPAPGSIKPGPFSYPNVDDTLAPRLGNKAIALKNCRHVIFRDFTIYHGGHFAILATAVDNWTCENLMIDTNRDGIDFDCCQNVRVSDCAVNSPYDDGICPKSSFGLGYNRPSENITITNCLVSGYDEGTLIDGTRRRNVREPVGRIKLGTEANGGFKRITISNCVFDHCRGLALEEVDGGLLEDVTVSNLALHDIFSAPIYIRLGARLRGPSPIAVGAVRRVKIDNVVASDVAADQGVLVSGLAGHPVEELTLSHILILSRGGGTAAQAARLVPEDEAGYPEPSRLGTLPSYGLFLRHVRGLSLDHVEVAYAGTEERPAVFLQDASGASFNDVRAEPPAGRDAARLVARQASGLTLRDCPGMAP